MVKGGIQLSLLTTRLFSLNVNWASPLGYSIEHKNLTPQQQASPFSP